MRGRLIVFEGIDGSGKTTLSHRVAAQLRERGLRVVHVRAGGKLASATAERIRELARDQRHLRLAPFAELLLYVARESQQLDERIRPALAEADVVIADRFFHTAQVLAVHGRGLPRERVEPVLAAASAGLEAHLTVLVDVDPHVARARRRADKIARPGARTGSRKGLAGASLMHRLRRGYLEVAAQTPERWLIADNSEADLALLVERVTCSIVTSLAQAPARWSEAQGDAPARIDAGTAAARRRRAGHADTPARDAFLAWIDDRLAVEPEVAAYLLGGCAGPGFDERRRRAASVAGAIVAAGLRGLHDQVSWWLRRSLAADHPREVARSLVGETGGGEHAWALRQQLLARAPDAVAESLEGWASDEAWALRARLRSRAPAAVLASLAGDDSARAWRLRESWLRERGGEPEVLGLPDAARCMCASLRGLSGERAWTLRKQARAASPVGALMSLRGVVDDRSWRWRARFLDAAPRTVLATIHGLDDDRAWALREASWRTCKETIDSIAGMGGVRAWRLRELAADVHPSTVAKSLVGLPDSREARALLERLRRAYPDDLSLMRHAARLQADEPAQQLALG